eukprot:scaffold7392_cov286-Pinguiococcus_pyrenoidosus.AAC.9
MQASARPGLRRARSPPASPGRGSPGRASCSQSTCGSCLSSGHGHADTPAPAALLAWAQSRFLDRPGLSEFACHAVIGRWTSARTGLSSRLLEGSPRSRCRLP